MNNKTQLFCIHENSFIHNRCGIVSNVYSKVRLIHLLVTVPIHFECIIMSNVGPAEYANIIRNKVKKSSIINFVFL